MKDSWSKILSIVIFVIAGMMILVGVYSRFTGDHTGSELVVMGSILLTTAITVISSRRRASTKK